MIELVQLAMGKQNRGDFPEVLEIAAGLVGLTLHRVGRQSCAEGQTAGRAGRQTPPSASLRGRQRTAAQARRRRVLQERLGVVGVLLDGTTARVVY